MKIYNTLTGQKDELKKPLLRKLQLFVCGPTVYDEPHIGNTRTFIVFDMLVKYLRSINYKIDYLMNITDIDDKIINRAKEEGVDPVKFARRYEEVFFQNIKTLGIDAVNTY